MDKQLLLDRYAERLASKGKTRGLYLRFAGEYLDFANDDLGRTTVLKFLDHLKDKHGYHDGSINFVFRVIRTLYNRNNLDWPFTRGDAPQIREDEVDAPALDPGIIIEMIKAVKADGSPEERAFMPISTIYGTRRIELIELRQADVMLNDRIIHIATAKHGRERTHRMPEEIVPYLTSYNFDTVISEFTLLGIWYRLEARIRLKHINRVGFHSIRRTLNTLLLDVLPESVVMSFLRWKQRTSSNMPFRYSAQRFVGREGTTTKVVGEAKDVDTKVFACHPFLPAWRG